MSWAEIIRRTCGDSLGATKHYVMRLIFSQQVAIFFSQQVAINNNNTILTYKKNL